MSETKTTKKLTVKETIQEYQQISKQISELDKYRNTLQSKLTSYMQQKGLQEIEADTHRIRLYENEREIVTKKNLPPEIWARYATRVVYPRLYISQIRQPGTGARKKKNS